MVLLIFHIFFPCFFIRILTKNLLVKNYVFIPKLIFKLFKMPSFIKSVFKVNFTHIKGFLSNFVYNFS